MSMGLRPGLFIYNDARCAGAASVTLPGRRT
jgi:hypothetical protein